MATDDGSVTGKQVRFSQAEYRPIFRSPATLPDKLVSVSMFPRVSNWDQPLRLPKFTKKRAIKTDDKQWFVTSRAGYVRSD